MSDRSAAGWRRWSRLLAFAGRLSAARIWRGDRRLMLAVALVALAVGLLVTLTGISLGLADPLGGQSPTADYWLLPASGGELTAAFAVDGPTLGGVHDRNKELQARDDVTAATPVLTEIIRVRPPGSSGEPEAIVAIGVIPTDQPTVVGGVPTSALGPGDPYYGDGEYNGEWTGDVVLSPAAAETLDVTDGEQLTVGSTASGRIQQGFEVAAIEAAEPRAESVPIAVVRLSELQALTGDDQSDQADSILLQTTGSIEESSFDEESARLVGDSAVGPDRLVDDDQALGLAVAALLVGFVSAVLQTATAVGLDVEATRDELLALAAIGLAPRSRLLVTGSTAIWISALGGIVGVGIGWVVLTVLSTDFAATVGTPPPTVRHPWLAPYGLGVALLAGLCAAIYPVVLVDRLETTDGGIQWR